MGSHLAAGLISRGFETVILDDLSAGTETRIPKGARFVRGDIRDAAKVAEAIEGCDTVFHLAARVDLQKSIREPEDCFSVNIEGTRLVAEAAARIPGCRLVFASSAAVYPLNPSRPLRESDAVPGETPYAVSKRKGEQVLESLAARGLSYLALRCFNVYGPGQKADSAYAAVIPKFIAMARAGQPLRINGSGEQTRDFLHVSDVVACYLSAAQSSVNDVLNSGTGEATSIRQLAEWIAAFEGKSRLEFLPALQGDASSSVADPSLCRERLGFQPRITIQQGLRDLYFHK